MRTIKPGDVFEVRHARGHVSTFRRETDDPAPTFECEECNVDVDGCTGGWDDDNGEPGGPCSDCRRANDDARRDAMRGFGGVEWHAWNDRRIAEGGKP